MVHLFCVPKHRCSVSVAREDQRGHVSCIFLSGWALQSCSAGIKFESWPTLIQITLCVPRTLEKKIKTKTKQNQPCSLELCSRLPISLSGEKSL